MASRRILSREQEVAREEDFSMLNGGWDRKAVCKRCHCVMNDCEPMDFGGCFYHPDKDKKGKPHKCRNSGRQFNTSDAELEPFLRKGERRLRKRNGISL